MLLKNILLQYSPLPLKCIEELEQSARLVVYEPLQPVLRQGEMCQYFYFNKEGILRVCHECDGKEHTILFGTEGDIYTCMHSWVMNEKSEFSLIPVIQSEIYEISYFAIRKVMAEFPEFIQWMMRLSMLQLWGLEKRYLMACDRSAEDRLREYLVTEDKGLGKLSGKTIGRCVPLKHIASYLGITPETMSRLRRKIVKS